MIKFTLPDGLSGQMDVTDAHLLHLPWRTNNSRGRLYIVRSVRGEAKFRLELMHRVIMGLGPDDTRVVDHIDGNGLNNCRANLRICTRQQNNANRAKCRQNKSGFKGVYREKGRFSACITVDGKTRRLGSYATAEEAARAYDSAAVSIQGEFARLNNP